MQDLKNIIAKNISKLRKQMGYTQLSFAEKLNYSDKAVSKWERGESVPDVVVLKQIADLFGVSVDYLLSEEHKQIEGPPKKRFIKNRLLITLGSIVSVWCLATLIFISLLRFGGEEIINEWQVFIHAIPISAVLALIFNSIWGKRKLNWLFISLLMWSILLSICVLFLSYNLWLFFIIGIPCQIVILIFSGIRKNNQ